MDSSITPKAAPTSVRLALNLGWLTVLAVLVAKFWPFWTNAAAMLPPDTNWLARLIAMLVASLFLLFTPFFIGQLVAAVCLVLLARRRGWARWLFLAGVLVSIMLTVAIKVGRVVLIPAMSFYVQLLLLAVEVLFVVLLFARSSDEWFRRRDP